MAFNFNWSPLTADAAFYTRAQELLTSALNKSPKPAIIVDNILVNELNLGNVPPELEILEIGDLAEDRFRGTFKMSYNGNAFLTLKTRVQANPLNTYLITRPSFASPQPLAAATGLTIPLQITLSDFKLSAFIILVFSRQKGLTIVFRNDPLESLKVSSTFDSIPFVAYYLQKEIEGQLRILLMDELPAIIHRLSLRFLTPEHRASEGSEINTNSADEQDEPAIDPFASLPQDPVDSAGNALSAAQIASLSMDSSVETQSLFSQKNLIRLATLTDSHRTLSLFTPSIRDAVFRAWTGPLERGEMTGLQTRSGTPALSRTHSHASGLSTTYTFDSGPQTRPTLYSFASSNHSLSYGGGRHSKGHSTRKRRKRVINLRKQTEDGEPETIHEDESTVADTASVTESTSSAPSVFSAPPLTSSSRPLHDLESSPRPSSPLATYKTNAIGNHSTDGLSMVAEIRGQPSLKPPSSPIKTNADFERDRLLPQDLKRTLRARQNRSAIQPADLDTTPRASTYLPDRVEAPSSSRLDLDGMFTSSKRDHDKEDPFTSSSSRAHSGSSGSIPNFVQYLSDSTSGSSIAEKAWMMRMAHEIAKKYQEEREKGTFGSSLGDQEQTSAPPPAYAR